MPDEFRALPDSWLLATVEAVDVAWGEGVGNQPIEYIRELVTEVHKRRLPVDRTALDVLEERALDAR